MLPIWLPPVLAALGGLCSSAAAGPWLSRFAQRANHTAQGIMKAEAQAPGLQDPMAMRPTPASSRPPPVHPKPLHLTMSNRVGAASQATSPSETDLCFLFLQDSSTALRSASQAILDQNAATLRPLHGNQRVQRSREGSEHSEGTTVYNTAHRSTLDHTSPTPAVNRVSFYFNPAQVNPFKYPCNKGSSSSQAAENHQEICDDFTSSNQLDVPAVDTALRARAIHDFSGQAAFGELSFARNDLLVVEAENIGGGWSVGFVDTAGGAQFNSTSAERGLIPIGFYEPLLAVRALTNPTDQNLDHKDPDGHATSGPHAITTPNLTTAVHQTLNDSRGVHPCDLASSATLRASSPSPLSDKTDSVEQSADPVDNPTRSLSSSVIIAGVEFEPAVTLSVTGSASAGGPTRKPRVTATSTSKDVPAPLPRPPSACFAARNAHWLADDAEESNCQTPVASGVDDEAFGWRDIFGVADELTTPSAEEIESLLADFSVEVKQKQHELNEVSATSPLERVEISSADLSAITTSTTSDDPDLCQELETPHTAFDEADDAQDLTALEAPACPSQRRVDSSRPGAIPQYVGTAMSTNEAVEAEKFLGVAGSSTKSARSEQAQPPTPCASSRIWDSTPIAAIARRVPIMRGHGKHEPLKKWLHTPTDNTSQPDGEDSNVYHIDDGPSWRDDSPSFAIRVSSPELQERENSSGTISTFVTYTLSAYLAGSEEPFSAVTRRYSQFVALHDRLVTRFFSPSLIYVPDLPSKHLNSVRFGHERALETRRRDLERWCTRICRHPVLKASDELRGFLTIESDKELAELLRPLTETLASETAMSFVHSVFYPAFNIDLEDARELGQAFELHCRAMEMGGGIARLENAIKIERESLMTHATSVESTARAMARLIAGQELPGIETPRRPSGIVGREQYVRDMNHLEMARAWHVQTNDGALSAREGDSAALSISKALQATAESMYETSQNSMTVVNDGLLSVQELLKEVANPLTRHQDLIDTHHFVIAEYELFSTIEEDENGVPAHDILARCETMLNVTSAAMNLVLSERRDDLRTVAESYLSAQIERHEKAVEHLSNALAHFSPEAFHALALTGPRLNARFDLTRSPPRSTSVVPRVIQPSSYGVPASRISSSTLVGDAVGSVIGLTRGASAQRRQASGHRANSTSGDTWAGTGVSHRQRQNRSLADGQGS